MDDRKRTNGEDMLRRAHGVALGLADAGLSQAEEMLRRVSPEGRAQARRERQARARRRNRMLARIAVALLVAILILNLLVAAGLPMPVGLALIAAALAGGGALLARRQARVGSRTGQRDPAGEALATADLRRLPAQATSWLGDQRRALPAPAVPIADSLGRRLDELTPQLARLSPDEPAADAIRKLVATELPGLVEGWRGVPASLRGVPRADGRTPDAHLLDGLTLIDAEVARMTEQLARGAVDEVATQGRYLELKYRGEGEY